MENLIVANWKLNPATLKKAEALFKSVQKGVKGIKNTEVVVCPPFVYLPMLKGLVLGAQDVFWEEDGAFTGEISAMQVKDLKVEYVIVGHSERRKYFGETDEIINKKIKAVLGAGLKPIFCIGENEGEDRSTVLQNQIKKGLENVSSDQIKNIVIAYEPVWAIGTGNNCSVVETKEAAAFIKKIITDLYGKELSEQVRIIYGGSVNSKNSADYIKNGGVNGLLVGGASLQAEEFSNIVTSIHE